MRERGSKNMFFKMLPAIEPADTVGPLSKNKLDENHTICQHTVNELNRSPEM